MLIGLGVVGLFLVWGVTAAMNGGYLTTVVTAGWAISLLCIFAGLASVVFGRTSIRTHTDAVGLAVLRDERFSSLLTAGVLAFIVGGGLFTAFAPFGHIDLPISRGKPILFPSIMGSAVLMTAAGLVTAWRRGGLGHVRLTPALIEIADVAALRSFEWTEVLDVVDHAESRRGPRTVVLRLRDGGEAVISSADVYLPGGAGLYWLVRHYWKHPEDRDELVDGRAVERLRKGEFDLG
ncbi:hypothetical protein [Mycobacterium sp. NAZ190054]|uniref:hypothetical protein n=1 Tax=Mycobacterium sp. NAZ190054 TaxID=1747766 RepID=UPI001E516719|nr:hypothetical protein [Mycobacterium sp. NAZ190054]